MVELECELSTYGELTGVGVDTELEVGVDLGVVS